MTLRRHLELVGGEWRALAVFLVVLGVSPFTGFHGPASIMALPFPVILGAALGYAVWADALQPP